MFPGARAALGEGKGSALDDVLGGRQNGFASTLSNWLALLSCFLPYKGGQAWVPILGWGAGGVQ